MSKRNILFIAIVAVFVFFLYAGACRLMGYSMLGSKYNASYLSPVFSGHEGEVLPSVDLLMTDSMTHVNIADIPSGKPIVLIQFGPYCPYCQAEVDEIISNIELLNNIQFYFLTAYSYSEMKAFYYKNALQKYDNIKVGIDYKHEFSKYFKTMLIPCVAIYNSNRKLNAVYLGVVKHDQIIEVVKN